MRQGDHSATLGISVSLLLERLSSPKLGSSRRHFGTVVRSLCWRSILTTYTYKTKEKHTFWLIFVTENLKDVSSDINPSR